VIERINVLDLIIILGAIQGIIFALYLWRRPLQNRKASLFLSLFILGFALSSTYYMLETLGIRGYLNIWDFSPLYCPIIIVASLYLFVRALIYPNAAMDLFGKVLIGLSGIQIMWQICFSIVCLVDRSILFDKQHIIFKGYDFFDVTLLLLSVVVFALSIKEIFEYDKTLKNNYAEIDEFSLSWLNKLFFFLFGIWILFAIPTMYEMISDNSPFSMYYPMWIATAFLIYWIGYSTYFRRAKLSPAIYHTENKLTAIKTTDTKLSENTKLYHSRLTELMIRDKVYLDQDLNLKSLAEQLDISSGYLSQIINQYEKKNFFDYINSHRVDAIKAKIGDDQYSHMNLLGIAYDSGFKSKSTFNLAFKKLTGLTPSAYKKSLSD
jgi:AraC-like DNA-binding protein